MSGRVIAHEPGDLTLTAEAGVTIREVQDLLARHRQFVALDPPDPASATLGGVIAAGRDGPMAARFGSVRDQVLGLTVRNGDGRVTKAGGRVVKNVTGYDLCRLYTGSRGALGTILEATVRVKPRPESTTRLDFAFASVAEAFARGSELRNRIPEIASVQIVGPPASGPPAFAGVLDPKATGVRLTAIIAGLTAFVEAVSAEIRSLVGTPPLLAAPCDPLAFRVATPPSDATLVQLATLPSKLLEACSSIDPLLTPPLGSVWDILRGVRESWHHASKPPFVDERALDAALTRFGATLDCPEDAGFAATLASRLPGQVPGGLAIMRKLEEALGPAGVLGPAGPRDRRL